MRHFTHYDPHSLSEALTLLDQHGEKCLLNAGGTDLITALHGEILPVYPEAIINLKTIPGLDDITCSHDTLCIGATVILTDLAENPIVQEFVPALAAAAQAVGSPQIRNVATIGGNLCQNTRCWYYRYPARLNGGCSLMCPRKGGGACLAVTGDNRYHAILGGRKCFAVCPSDTAVVLAALDASVILLSQQGERKVPVAKFYHPLGTVMEKQEILVRIEIPLVRGTLQSFHKYAQRKAIDFAVCSACAVVEMDGTICRQGSISLGAVAPGPYCPDIAGLLNGKQLTPELIESVAQAALNGARALSMNAYKIDIAKTLVKDVLYDILQKSEIVN